MAYVIQSTWILLAPTLVAASIYMELGRIIRLTNGEPHSIISSSKITKVYVTGDIVCLLVQSGGNILRYESDTSHLLTDHQEVGCLQQANRLAPAS